jgi:hypothetical protein
MARWLAASALGCLVILAAVNPAQAGLMPVSVTVTPEADNYRWTYAIVLPTDSQLQAGNYFTIYDFAGFVPGSAHMPAGWEFSYGNIGPTPPGVVPTDDPDVPNLHWYYNGATITDGQTGLGNFWAISSYDGPVDSYFTARTNRTSDGHIDTNITTTTVPVPGPQVPEPATLAMAGLGLPLVGFGVWARRHRARVA